MRHGYLICVSYLHRNSGKIFAQPGRVSPEALRLFLKHHPEFSGPVFTHGPLSDDYHCQNHSSDS